MVNSALEFLFLYSIILVGFYYVPYYVLEMLFFDNFLTVFDNFWGT